MFCFKGVKADKRLVPGAVKQRGVAFLHAFRKPKADREMIF